MNVQELIDVLNKVKNKNIPVRVIAEDGFLLDLKNAYVQEYMDAVELDALLLELE